MNVLLYTPHSVSGDARIENQEANSEIKDLCRIKKEDYFKRIEIKVNMKRNSKGFWNFVRRLNGPNKKMLVNVEPDVLQQKTQIVPYPGNEDLKRNLSRFEVEAAISKSKNGNAPEIKF